MLIENIITERLVLRDMTKEDAQDVYNIWGTEANTKYMHDPVESVEEVKAIFLSTEPRVGYLLVVTDKESKEIVGTICPGPTNNPGEWGFGYSFKQSVWGKGYATETLNAVIEFGKSEGINKFISDCAAENKGSAKVLEKCGLQFDHKSSFKQPHLGVVYEAHVYKLELDK
jgi:RimJ/RimL family protein N-acetyltransferase